jgi:hypothetical protein
MTCFSFACQQHLLVDTVDMHIWASYSSAIDPLRPENALAARVFVLVLVRLECLVRCIIFSHLGALRNTAKKHHTRRNDRKATHLAIEFENGALEMRLARIEATCS